MREMSIGENYEQKYNSHPLRHFEIFERHSGFVDVFATDGTLVKHFALQGPLHSPWGIALAPDNFGPMSNAILITNNVPAAGSMRSIPRAALSLARFGTRVISPSKSMIFGRYSSARAQARMARPTSCSLRRAPTTTPTVCSA